jgi:hypothetical protein
MYIQLGKRKSIKMLKRKCAFTENPKAEYQFIKENQHAGKVFCTICKSLFSIEHGGLSDILQHNKEKKHWIAVSNLSYSQNNR